MAAQDEIINKIYRIQIQEADGVVNRIREINDELDKYKQAVRNAQKEKLSSKDDLDKMSALNKSIAESEAQIKKLTAERSVAKKELDLYVKSQQKAVEQQLKEDNAIKALPGSYNALYAEYKRLNAELRSTPQDTEKFIAIRAEVGKLKTQVDDFNRQFTKDGTLVGEYTTGVLQALKASGLDELIQHQADLVKQNLDKLDGEFIQLQQELLDLKNTGKGSFEEIERKIIDNRKETTATRAEMERLNTSMQGVGGIGQQITDGLNNGFKSLTGNLAGLVVGFGALQGLSGFLHDAVAQFEQAETATARLTASLDNMGRGAELDGLNKSIDELSKKFKAIDNDDLSNAAEKLITYGKVSEGQIKQLLPIIIDFAAKQRISIQESTDIIIKGLEGSGKALKTYGIELKAGATDSENFAVITQQLGSKVAGAQQTFENTASGGLANFRQGMKDAQEQLGSKLLPVLAQFLALMVPIVTVIVSIPFGIWATGIAIVVTGYIALNRELVVNRIMAALSTVADYAMATAKVAVAVATGIATAAVKAFNFAVQSTPLGRFLSLLALVLVPLAAFASGVFNSVKGMAGLNEETERLRQRQEELNKINEKATETFNNQKFKIEQLLKATKDHNASLADRQKALNELIALDPKHLSGLTLQNIEMQKGVDIINKYVDGLQRQAIAEASKNKLIEAERKRFDQELELQKLTASRDSLLANTINRKGDDYMGFDSKRIEEAENKVNTVKENLKQTEGLINDIKNLVKKNGGDYTFTESGTGNAADKKAAEDAAKVAAEARKKAFDEADKDLKRKFDNDVKAQERARDLILDDITKTEVEKEQARITFNERFLLLQNDFNKKELDLEHKYKQDSIDSEIKRKDEVYNINRELANSKQKLTKDQYDSELSALEDKLSKELALIELNRTKNLETAETTKDIEAVNRAADLESLNAERNISLQKIAILKQELEAKQISEQEYYDAVKKLAQDDAALRAKVLEERKRAHVNTLRELIIRELDLNEIQKQILDQSAILFREVISDRFQRQRETVDQERDQSLERIDREKQEALSHSHSASEKATIDQQYAQRRKEIEKQAAEELKRIKRGEVYVALASELSNIAVQAAANPANAVTFGAAGTAQYALLAAIASVRAGIQIAAINRQQFEYGGSIPLSGGRFKGPSHAQGGIPTSLGEFEGDELAIINKRSALSKNIYKVSGTPAQIASAINTIGGGINFQPGARLSYEGLGSGSSLQAPHFEPSNRGRSEYDERLLAVIAEVHNRIDRIEVVQVTNTVTDAQAKAVKQNSIANI